MKSTSVKAIPSLPASSRMQMPSGGNSTPMIKGMIKGGTKTKLK